MKCIHVKTINKNGKITKKSCRNKTRKIHGYCHVHDEYPNYDEFGRCCFCGNPCNPNSQACGRCARGL